MNIRLCIVVAGVASITPVVATSAAGIALPGDRGPMGAGATAFSAPAGTRPAGPPPERPPPSPAPGPSIHSALAAAQAIVAACRQYPLGLAVVDSAGVAKLVYVPDGSEAWHGYSAVRKAYTAIAFGMDTSQVMQKGRGDPTIVGKFKADPNLQAQPGGIVLKVGNRVIGAIGVSGAEPGGHDEECAIVGRDRIKHELKVADGRRG